LSTAAEIGALVLCLQRFDPFWGGYNLKKALRSRSVGGFRRHISGGEIGAEWSEIPFEPVLPCYLPVTPPYQGDYLPDKPDYLPVKLLFGERSRFSANRLKTNGFRWIFATRIAPEQGKKRGKQGGRGRSMEK
jgi:hypothetical protein